MGHRRPWKVGSTLLEPQLFLLECTQYSQKVGTNLPVEDRPGRRAKLAAKQGTRDVRTFIYKRTGWSHPGKQPDHDAKT